MNNNNMNNGHLPSKPLTNSYSFYSKTPDSYLENNHQEEIILGVDEAGRGPVLGPMVYAVTYIPKSRNDELKKMGVDDSKGLTEERREELFDLFQEKLDWIGWAVKICSPQDLSEGMLRRIKHNLNEIAHETTIELIKGVLKKGVNVKHIFVDTVGPPEKYQEKLKRFFPGIEIKVAKKADSLYPSVSAASICAKVTRDMIIKEWKFIENELDGTISKEFGSGYPSDPKTVDWMNRSFDPVFGFPRIIRFSWGTSENSLKKNARDVEWNSAPKDNDNNDNNNYNKSKKRKSRTTSSSHEENSSDFYNAQEKENTPSIMNFLNTNGFIQTVGLKAVQAL